MVTSNELLNSAKNARTSKDIRDLFKSKQVVRTLEELIDFNNEHKALEMPPGEYTTSLMFQRLNLPRTPRSRRLARSLEQSDVG